MLISDDLRTYARQKVQAAFFDQSEPTGFGIERIVFTYLDYLLAKNDSNFNFTYRNSIEHFFPQHADPEQINWDRMQQNNPALHLLGNLALVSIGANSKFSNNLPENKVRFASILAQSKKLELMSQQVKQLEIEGRQWDEVAINAHHLAMRELLKNDLDASRHV